METTHREIGGTSVNNATLAVLVEEGGKLLQIRVFETCRMQSAMYIYCCVCMDAWIHKPQGLTTDISLMKAALL